MLMYIVFIVCFAEITRPRSDLINNEVNNSNHHDKFHLEIVIDIW
jgi:hypothetical protein